MLTALYILGSMGGILILAEEVRLFVKKLMKKYTQYKKYEAYYKKTHNEGVKIPMGFRTEKEQTEIEAMMAKKG